MLFFQFSALNLDKIIKIKLFSFKKWAFNERMSQKYIISKKLSNPLQNAKASEMIRLDQFISEVILSLAVWMLTEYSV